MRLSRTDKVNLSMIIILSIIIFICCLSFISCINEQKAFDYANEHPSFKDKICPKTVVVQHKIDTITQRVDSIIYDTAGLAAWSDLVRFNTENHILDSISKIPQPVKIVYQTRTVRITDTKLYLDKATLNEAVKTAYLKGYSDRDKRPLPFDWWKLLAFCLIGVIGLYGFVRLFRH